MAIIDGLGDEWDPIVQYIPEDKREEAAPLLRKRHEEYTAPLGQYEPWKEIVKSGTDPALVEQALGLMGAIETQPQMVYETLQRHLGLTPKQAKEVMEKEEEGSTEGLEDITKHPQFVKLNEQVNTLAQITVAEREAKKQADLRMQQENALEEEINALKKKYGDFDDDTETEVLMRMAHLNVDAETAYKDFDAFASRVRQRRPAPYVLGSGGSVPAQRIDPKKLNESETKKLVAQMLDHANQEV